MKDRTCNNNCKDVCGECQITVSEPMKLYTEEQVKKMIEDMGSFSNGGIDYRINQMTPIELPNNQEIEEFSKIFNRSIDRDAFIVGAHWVLNQIKQKDETN